MEYLDVIDKQGRNTGVVASRADVHSNGLLHTTVHVWIINEKHQILIQKKDMKVSSNGGLWDISTTGHVKSGMSVLEGAICEVAEELGVEIPKKYFKYLFRLGHSSVKNNGKYQNNEINNVYLVEHEIEKHELKIPNSEVSEVRWVHYKKLFNEIDNNPKKFVKYELEYQKMNELLEKKLGDHFFESIYQHI